MDNARQTRSRQGVRSSTRLKDANVNGTGNRSPSPNSKSSPTKAVKNLNLTRQSRAILSPSKRHFDMRSPLPTADATSTITDRESRSRSSLAVTKPGRSAAGDGSRRPVVTAGRRHNVKTRTPIESTTAAKTRGGAAKYSSTKFTNPDEDDADDNDDDDDDAETIQSTESSLNDNEKRAPSKRNESWACITCTFLNSPSVYTCTMCSSKRPTSRSLAAVPLGEQRVALAVRMQQSFVLEQLAASSSSQGGGARSSAAKHGTMTATSSQANSASSIDINSNGDVPRNAVRSSNHPSAMQRKPATVGRRRRKTKFNEFIIEDVDAEDDNEEVSGLFGLVDSDVVDKDAQSFPSHAEDHDEVKDSEKQKVSLTNPTSASTSPKKAVKLTNGERRGRKKKAVRQCNNNESDSKQTSSLNSLDACWSALDLSNRVKFEISCADNKTFLIYELVQQQPLASSHSCA